MNEPDSANESLETQQKTDNKEQELSNPQTPSTNSSSELLDDASIEDDTLVKRYIQSCQTGDIITINELIESGLIDLGSDVDSDNVSGLHWAAINNRLSIVQYLISKGAKVDAEGGDLKATPLHWACRYGFVHIVDCLLKNGADPSKTDSQGFNALHLAVHSSNIMLVIYILVFVPDLFIDETDPSGRTALHWASYQGDSLSVNVLLKFKAGVRKVDEKGFLPIHWSFIRSQKDCIRSLIEKGSDIFQKTSDDKDSFDVARDMNSLPVFYQALYEAGFKPDGSPIYKPFDAKWAKLITFLYPYILLGLSLKLLASYHIITTLISFIIIYFVSSHILNKYIFPCYILQRAPLLKSPFLSGIFSGTTFWVIITWIIFILPYTISESPLLNLIFFITATSVVYNFEKSMFKNPGYIEPPQSDDEIRVTIESLLNEGKYDANNFCINTLIRKPLRSRYSTFASKCVARFDHYCPWVYNDIGLRNHKPFMFFVFSLEAAMISYVLLAFEYFDELDDDKVVCHFLNEDLCAGFTHSGFIFYLTFWTIFQIIWVTFLLFSQSFQISKGLTTVELSTFTNNSDTRVNPYYSSLPSDFSGSSNPASSPRGHHHKNCLTTFCLLTGLNQFVIALKETFGLKSTRSVYSQIPFDYGVRQNCIDFWVASGDDNLKFRNILKFPVNGEATLNGQIVDYYKLYLLPEKHAEYSDNVV